MAAKKNPAELTPEAATLLETLFLESYSPPPTEKQLSQRIHSTGKAVWLKIRTEIDRSWPYDLLDVKNHIEKGIQSGKISLPQQGSFADAKARYESVSWEKTYGPLLDNAKTRRKFLEKIAGNARRVDIACDYDLHPARVGLLIIPALVRETYPEFSITQREALLSVYFISIPPKCIGLCEERGWPIEQFDKLKWPLIPTDDEIREMNLRGKGHIIDSHIEEENSGLYGKGGTSHNASGSPLPVGAVARNLHGSEPKKRRLHSQPRQMCLG